MTQKEPITIAAPIGVMAIVKGTANHHTASLDIVTTSGVDDGAFYPAECVSIYGEKQIEALRDFCDKLLKARAEFVKQKAEF